MALGAIGALREAGLRMPEDIGVLGFDDIRAASLPPYELTTVAEPIPATVERAVELLLARVADPDLPCEEVHIRGELIPTSADQNPLAQSRRPMDMMVQGRSMSLFQATHGRGGRCRRRTPGSRANCRA